MKENPRKRWALLVLILPLITANIGNAQDRIEKNAIRTDRPWIFHLGAGSSRAWNFVGVSRDVMQKGAFSLYWSAGIGTILIGAGVAWYSNRPGSGLVFSSTVGIVGADIAAVARLRLAKQIFLSAGACYGSFFMQYNGFVPIFAYEQQF